MDTVDTLKEKMNKLYSIIDSLKTKISQLAGSKGVDISSFLSGLTTSDDNAIMDSQMDDTDTLIKKIAVLEKVINSINTQSKVLTTPPAASETVASEPVVSEPVVSEPAASEPAASEPAASEPAASEPAASEPAASEPAASEPAASAANTSALESAGLSISITNNTTVSAATSASDILKLQEHFNMLNNDLNTIFGKLMQLSDKYSLDKSILLGPVMPSTEENNAIADLSTSAESLKAKTSAFDALLNRLNDASNRAALMIAAAPSAPEASAPEASAPEASAPEASAPEASAPETGIALSSTPLPDLASVKLSVETLYGKINELRPKLSNIVDKYSLDPIIAQRAFITSEEETTTLADTTESIDVYTLKADILVKILTNIENELKNINDLVASGSITIDPQPSAPDVTGASPPELNTLVEKVNTLQESLTSITDKLNQYIYTKGISVVIDPLSSTDQDILGSGNQANKIQLVESRLSYLQNKINEASAAIPGAPAPDSGAPAPDYGASAPEASAPEASAPEASAPEASAPSAPTPTEGYLSNDQQTALIDFVVSDIIQLRQDTQTKLMAKIQEILATPSTLDSGIIQLTLIVRSATSSYERMIALANSLSQTDVLKQGILLALEPLKEELNTYQTALVNIREEIMNYLAQQQ